MNTLPLLLFSLLLAHCSCFLTPIPSLPHSVIFCIHTYCLSVYPPPSLSHLFLSSSCSNLCHLSMPASLSLPHSISHLLSFHCFSHTLDGLVKLGAFCVIWLSRRRDFLTLKSQQMFQFCNESFTLNLATIESCYPQFYQGHTKTVCLIFNENCCFLIVFLRLTLFFFLLLNISAEHLSSQPSHDFTLQITVNI